MFVYVFIVIIYKMLEKEFVTRGACESEKVDSVHPNTRFSNEYPFRSCLLNRVI